MKQAWSSTVINCFTACGAVPADDDETEDPFAELDEHIDTTESFSTYVQILLLLNTWMLIKIFQFLLPLIQKKWKLSSCDKKL